MKQGKKPAIFCLKDQVFPFRVIFYVGPKPSQAQIMRAAKRYGVEFEKDFMTGSIPEARAITREWAWAGVAFVWLESWRMDADHLDTWTHEMVHVLAALSTKVGEPIGDGPNELQAYYAGWLTGEFIRRMEKF